MNHLGLIGKKLGHSGSPDLFQRFFEHENKLDWTYELFELTGVEDAIDLMKRPDLRGFNVTVPYKEQIIPLLDALSEEAQFVGAVNTVKLENGKSKGYNTDVFGFEKMLWIEDVMPENCMILGTGGASKAVQYVLKKHDVHVELVSRTPGDESMGYDEIDAKMLKEFDCIINTTPLGMHPYMDTLPLLPYEAFNKNHLAIDLIYNPEKTLFLGLAEANKARILNGSQMLRFQAEKAWEIFQR